jgi:hypothetical protein
MVERPPTSDGPRSTFTGEAYVRFATPKHAWEAHERHMNMIGQRCRNIINFIFQRTIIYYPHIICTCYMYTHIS